jgi:two-component system, chemotaxis family, sensor kinase CheA
VSELDTELTGIFRDEATQRLDQMDTVLLAIESGHADAEAVDSLFRNAHTIKGGASILGFGDIGTLAHAAEDILARVRDAGAFPPELAAPLLRATATLRALVTGSAEPIDDVMGDLAASRAMLPDGETSAPGGPVPEPAARRTPVPELPVPRARGPAAGGPAAGGPAAGGPAAGGPAAGGPAAGGPAADSAPAAGAPRTLRVPAAKIDHLIDVFGEFMQYRRRLAHSLIKETRLTPDLADILTSGERMLDDLKDTAIGMRTLPLSVMTGPLPRAVRDIARAVGKDVDFAVTGADTEIDRIILESLSEPLTHLLRNAVGHGIEPSAERERVGKPPRGRVELRAVPRGSMVEIEVADDGRGVAPEVIEHSRREGSLAGLLTRPGYSTAGEVTELAGRGVGLDAVRAYVSSLGGSLDIRSEPGQGMHVVLLLPLALALTEVLLFERGAAVYGVPLAAVDEVVVVAKTLLLQGQPALEIRGRSLPVTDIATVIDAAAPPLADRSPAVVISAGGHRAIVTCDALLGTEEVVVKPLGLAGAAGYLGASILGDGRIALLVAPAMLTRGSPRAAGGTALAAASGAAAAPKVLVVEDSFTVRELQRSILEAAGYPVVTARDGRDALAALDRDTQIALVITDLEMPELDGLGLTRAIRADAARSSLPVVVVTSRGSEDDRRRGIEAGADAYMAKRSFDQQTLLATVERLVGR